MYIYRCKMCGGTLNIQENDTIVKCEYCETKQTVPRMLDEEKAALYERANHLRINNEFDKAIGIYEKILTKEVNDSEIYWLLVLCKYGVEYVEDPQTRKHIPTINRLQYTSIYSDENYKMALKCADSFQRDIYEEQAKEIDRVQKEILKISQQEEPFDVFICYKETDNNGRRTYDSVLANELYHELTKEGFRVFFSRITLEDKLGVAYEPYIFAALNSSKVMVVIGTKKDYFEAVWVKNEWSRYLSLIKNGEKKILIPAYKDIDPYHLPEEFSHLQAQDMSKLGFMQDLTRAISKMINKDKPTEKVIVNSFNPTVEPLLKRIQIFLEDGEIVQAKEYVERVLDLDPENSQAYLYKLMIDLNITKKEEFKSLTNTFDENTNYKKIIKFGDNKLKLELEEYNSNIKNKILDAKYQMALKMFKEATNANDYYFVVMNLKDIEYYKDSASIVEQSNERIKILEENEKKYQTATNLIKDTYRPREISEYKEAISILSNIKDYKDSNKKIIYCKEKIVSLLEKQRQLDEERIKQKKRRDKRKLWTKKFKKIRGLLIVSLTVLCLFIGVIVYANTNIVVDGLVLSRNKKTLVSYESVGTTTEIPNSVLYIEENAFRGCKELIRVTFEEGSKLESIGASAFRDCINLTMIEIPDTVKSIGNYAFCYCKKLTNFTIPDSVTSINKGAFYGCVNLKSIEIPKNVTVIGPSVFAECPDLKIYCEVNSKLTSWDNEWNSDLNEVIWEYGEKNDDQIQQEMPAKLNVVIYKEDEKTYINFGRYPQTVVIDTNLIKELDKITTTNKYGYIEYNGNEYKKQVADRGSSYSIFQNGNEVVDGATYYFKVEPIKWRVLETANGSYKLLSEYLLDTQQFYTSGNVRSLNGQKIFENNYEYSNIRAWLNGYNGKSYYVADYTNKGFIDIAFTEEEQAIIKTTLVDNSVSSTGDSTNKYACDNTYDKIYLLSVQEATNTIYGFNSDSSREAQPTDYAAARYCYMNSKGNGYWWLRSPNPYSSWGVP